MDVSNASISGHTKEIYDLAWSPCGNYFITASIDNTARVWSLAESKDPLIQANFCIHPSVQRHAFISLQTIRIMCKVLHGIHWASMWPHSQVTDPWPSTSTRVQRMESWHLDPFRESFQESIKERLHPTTQP